MLTFAAITPHPPILIPAIGQDSLKQIKKTQTAMQQLAENFYAARPETVIIISPHGQLMEKAFTLNTAPEFRADFKSFGDLETELEFKGDAALAYQIKEATESQLPIQLLAEENLDHGVSVPLYYLTQAHKDVKIIPLGYSLQDRDMHFKLGRELAEIIHTRHTRVAVVASGDLSHALTQDAPAGYSPAGKKFDEQLIELIKNKRVAEVLKLDKALVEQAAECGLKSIIILLGILQEHNYQPQILSYEGPFGIGYAVCNFNLNG